MLLAAPAAAGAPLDGSGLLHAALCLALLVKIPIVLCASVLWSLQRRWREPRNRPAAQGAGAPVRRVAAAGLLCLAGLQGLARGAQVLPIVWLLDLVGYFMLTRLI